MKYALAIFLGIMFGSWLVFAHAAYAQCAVPAPVVPPHAKTIVITVPGDGGTTGCTFNASAPGAPGTPKDYPTGNGKCATVVAMGDQALAIDNGWNDGGVP